jgi:deoxycytidine triphosphate deaminase
VILIFIQPGLNTIPVKESTSYRDITEKIVLKEGETFLLLPGQACLGITKEKVKISPKLCGLLGYYNIILYIINII